MRLEYEVRRTDGGRDRVDARELAELSELSEQEIRHRGYDAKSIYRVLPKSEDDD